MPAKASDLGNISASELVPCVVDSDVVVPTALFGYSLWETSGTATATVRIHDGTSAAAPALATIAMIANESVRDWFGDQTIEVFSGALFVEVIAGRVNCQIWWG